MDNISFKSIVQMYLRNKIIFIVVMIVAFALGLIVAMALQKYMNHRPHLLQSQRSQAPWEVVWGR